MKERKFVIREAFDTFYDVTESELIRRLNIICDEMHSPKRSIDILVNGTVEKKEKLAK